MPTLPPERTPLPSRADASRIRHRQVAESFGADAGRYDRARPSYPDALVERIVAASPGRGRPRRRLRHRHSGPAVPGGRLPGARGRPRRADGRAGPAGRGRGRGGEVRRLGPGRPGVRRGHRRAGLALGGPGRRGGQGGAGAAAGRPAGGVLERRSGPRRRWREAFAAVYRRVLPDSPLSRRGDARPGRVPALCAKAADGMRQAGAFGEPEEWRFDWERPYTRDEWLDLVPTFGGYRPVPAGHAGGAAGRHRRGRRRGGGQLHDGLHRGGGHRGAQLIRRNGGQPLGGGCQGRPGLAGHYRSPSRSRSAWV